MNLIQQIVNNFSVACGGGSFFGFPKWFKYLNGRIEEGVCSPVLTSLNDIWLIVLAIIELMLRVVVLATIIYVIFGAFRMVYSRGNPDKINEARNTVIDAIVGLVIAVVAIAFITFIARRLQ